MFLCLWFSRLERYVLQLPPVPGQIRQFITAVSLWYIHTARDRVWERDREWDWDQCVILYDVEMFILVQDRDGYQYPLFPIVPIPFPLPPQSQSLRFRSHWDLSDSVGISDDKKG